jgi:hypothetical protein
MLAVEAAGATLAVAVAVVAVLAQVAQVVVLRVTEQQILEAEAAHQEIRILVLAVQVS